MTLTLIVAMARNGAIGRGNMIPWHAPGDLKAFRTETLGGAVIMGRRTWESLPIRPLPERRNLIVSRTLPGSDNVAPSAIEAVRIARANGAGRVYGIGGASVYAELLPVADRLLITRVDMDVEDADTFFPDFDEAGWRRVAVLPLEGPGPICLREEYLRVSPMGR